MVEISRAGVPKKQITMNRQVWLPLYYPYRQQLSTPVGTVYSDAALSGANHKPVGKYTRPNLTNCVKTSLGGEYWNKGNQDLVLWNLSTDCLRDLTNDKV